MRNIKYYYSGITCFALLMALVFAGCDRDNIEGLELATYPVNGNVFIDNFSGGLDYAAFGDSDVRAFEVVTDVTYTGAAAMRFAVPDVNDPAGAYVGGAYFTGVGRDMTGFDALTFWAKASKSATIDVIGFGNDLGENRFVTTIDGGISVNSNWKKYIIPIPDPSKLTQERGMLFYAEGPENGLGYTFWLDEVKFEKLGTLAPIAAGVFDGQNLTVSAETGATFNPNGYVDFNMPNGLNQRVNAAPAYFTYSSTNPGVATVNDAGIVTILAEGEAVITATLGDLEVAGSLTVSGTGAAAFPTVAPTPTVPEGDVISIFSNAYNNVPVDFFNGYWEFSTALDFDVQVNGDDIKRYTNLNFVGIQFTEPTQDISDMTHIHLDIWTPDPTDPPAAFRVLLADIGPDGSFAGAGDNSSHEVTITSPTLQTENWISLDLPLSSFLGLTGRQNLAQIVLSGDLPNVFVDNIYFYDDGMGGGGGGDVPAVAAPNPTANPGDVISVFSDQYTNEPSNLNPDWGQATIVSEVPIQGNNTLLYTGLDYQGLELTSSLDASAMTHLHIDVWTNNSSMLNAFLISTGPEETAYAIPVPTTGWTSLDIPLSNFAGVDLADIIQMKFDGNGNIYLDNIYFYSDDGSGGGDTPTVAAPTPSYAAGDVISVFSDAYTNIGGNLNPDWGQATVVSEVAVDGNNTLLYTGLNYQGLEFDVSQDVSGMTFLHLDFWTANSTTLNIFLISPGPAETPYSLTVPTAGWTSIDIPLTEFSSVVDLTDVIQFKFEGNGDIYIDNLLFRSE